MIADVSVHAPLFEAGGSGGCAIHYCTIVLAFGAIEISVGAVASKGYVLPYSFHTRSLTPSNLSLSELVVDVYLMNCF